MGELVSIVSYSRPSLMIIVSASQFHVYLLWGQRPFSIVSSPMDRFTALVQMRSVGRSGEVNSESPRWFISRPGQQLLSTALMNLKLMRAQLRTQQDPAPAPTHPDLFVNFIFVSCVLQVLQQQQRGSAEDKLKIVTNVRAGAKFSADTNILWRF